MRDSHHTPCFTISATRPLYLHAAFDEELEGLIEAAELDEGQEKRLEREFGCEYHLITRDDCWRGSPKIYGLTLYGPQPAGQDDGRLHG